MSTRGGPNITPVGPAPSPPENQTNVPQPSPLTNEEAFAAAHPDKSIANTDPDLLLELRLPPTVKQQLLEVLVAKVTALGGLIVRFGEKHYLAGREKSVEFVRWMSDRNLLLAFTGEAFRMPSAPKQPPRRGPSSVSVMPPPGVPFVMPPPVANSNPTSPHDEDT